MAKLMMAARSARDRDRLRKQVLENMGWQIFRIWSTDWFRNPKQELERLIKAIEKAKEQATLHDHEEEAAQAEVIEVSREELSLWASNAPAYVVAVLPREISHFELHLHGLSKLAGWNRGCGHSRSPVHFDEMARG